jgi:hypothetical protein
LADLQVNFKLMSGVRQDPSLVGGLVCIGMNAIATSAIYNGIALHAWNDAQLAELEDELGQIDFLQNYQFVMKGEALANIAPNYDFLKKQMYSAIAGYGQMPSEPHPLLGRVIDFLWPSGWSGFNKVSVVEAMLNGSEMVDLQARRIFPGKIDAFQTEHADFKNHWSAYAPWNILYTVASGPLLSASMKFAQAQVWIDETRIACALEGYRLVHNAYPVSLDTLVPDYIPEVPRDIMTGDPYHYVLRGDETFLLYSVGWNQTDERGEVVYKTDAPLQIDPAQGDWVWPMPQAAKP